MRPKHLIAAFLVVWTTSAAQAAVPFKVSVAGTSLMLPVPAGFSEPSDEAPVLRSRAEQIMPPQMRLLATYVDDSDLQAVLRGTPPAFRRYFMVSILRGKEADALDIRTFRAVKLEVADQNQTDPNQVREEIQNHLDSAARRIGVESGYPELALKIGESRQLGIFNETDSSISTLAVTKVVASNDTRELGATMGQATSLILLNGKVVFLAAYARIDSDADYSWLREQSESWIKSALKSDPK